MMLHILKNPVLSAQNLVQQKKINWAFGWIVVYLLAIAMSATLPYRLAAWGLNSSFSMVYSNFLVTLTANVFELAAQVLAFFVVSGLLFKTGIQLKTIVCLLGVNCAPDALGKAVMAVLPLSSQVGSFCSMVGSWAGAVLLILCYLTAIDQPKGKTFFSLAGSIMGGAVLSSLLTSTVQSLTMSLFL